VPSVSTGGARVLLVDDEEDLVQMGQQMLQRLGYDVVATTRSVKALEAFRAQPDFFDVVITDYLMPDMTGEDMAREMLRIRPNLPIVLVTGFSQSIGPDQAKDLGFREYLRKPVSVRTLGDAIRRALQPER
jgi:CheY-like chemotaxis protein